MAMVPDLICEVAWTATPYATSPGWYDESAALKSASGGFGASGDGDQAQAGSFTIVLDNSDGRFDPLASIAVTPLAGLISPSRRVRLRSTASPVRTLLTGWIDTIEISQAGVGWSTATISCIDGIGMLSVEELPPSKYDAEVLSDSPTRWFRLSEPVTDSKLTDSSANLSHGTWSSPGTAVDALAPDGGSAREFATASKAVEPSTPMTSTTWSVELWASPPRLTSGWQLFSVPLVSVGLATASTINVDWYTSVPGYSAIYATAYVPSASTGVYWGSTNKGQLTANVTDAPHHIVFTRSGATLNLYVDGALASTGSISGTVATPGAGVVLGGLADAIGSADGALGYYGSVTTLPLYAVDDVALYGTALSSTRVDVHWAAGQPVLASTRVTDVLDAVGWPAADRAIDTSTSWLSAGSWGGSAGGHLADVAATEQGRFFVDGGGIATFHAVSRQFTNAAATTSQLTASDDVSAANPYVSLDLSSRRATIANYSVAPRDGGVGGLAISAASVTMHRRLTVSTPSLHSTDVAAQNLAEWVLWHRQAADYHPARVVFAPIASEMSAILSRAIGDRVTVAQTPPPGTFATTWISFIEGFDFAFDVSSQAAVITYRLRPYRIPPAVTDGWLVWDVGRWDLAAWAI